MATTYKFRGQKISEDQFNNLRTIGLLGSSGLIDDRSAASSIAQTLLTKPNTFQQRLGEFLGGGSQATQQTPNYYTNRAPLSQIQEDLTKMYQATQSSDTTKSQSETQGNFGFGNQPGELFGKGGLLGEGGLVHSIGRGFADAGAIAQGLGINFRSLVEGSASDYEKIGKKYGLGTSAAEVLPYWRAAQRAYNDALSSGKSQEQAIQVAEQSLRSKQREKPINAISGIFDNSEVVSNAINNPLGQGTKTGIAIGSYGIPIPAVGSGGNILSRFLRGGVGAVPAGAAFGFGTSAPGEEVEGMLQGGATAFVGGGTLSALAPVVSRGLKNIGRSVQESGLNVKASKTPTGIQDAAAITQGTKQILRNKGINDFNAKGINKAYNELTDDFTRIAEGVRAPIPMNDVLDMWQQKLLEVGGDPLSNQSKYAFNTLASLGDTPRVSDVANIIRKLDEGLGNAYKALESGTRLPNQNEFSRLTLRQVLRDKLGNEVPELNTIYGQLATLHQAAGDAVSAYNKGSSLSLPLYAVGINIPLGVNIPLGNLPSNFRTTVGRGLQNFGTGIGELSSPISMTTIPRIISSTRDSRGETLPQESNQIDQTQTYQTIDITDQGAIQQRENLRNFLISGVVSEELTPAQATGYLDLFAPAPRQLSFAEQQKVSQINTAIEDLNTIKSLFSQGASLQSNLPNFLRSGEAQQLEAATSNVADIIGRLRSGAVITAAEEARFRNMLPKFGDTPQTAQANLDRLYRELSGIAVRSQ